MHRTTRRIGPIGTVTRLLAAAGLLYLAFFDGASWGLEWYDAAAGVGLVVYFLLAIAAHIRAGDARNLPVPVVMELLAVASLVV